MEQTAQERGGRCNFGRPGLDAQEAPRVTESRAEMEYQQYLLLYRYSKAPGHHPERRALGCPCWIREVWLDNLQWSLPTWSILWLIPLKHFPKLWQAFISSGIPLPYRKVIAPTAPDLFFFFPSFPQSSGQLHIPGFPPADEGHSLFCESLQPSWALFHLDN